MKHPGPEELIDLLDEAATPQTREHVAGCESCRARVDDLRSAMNLAARVEVPEPSPLFWDHLAARVQERIAEEPAPVAGRSFLTAAASAGAVRGVVWRWALPAALALVVLVMFVSRLTLPVTQPAPVRVATVAPADAGIEPLKMDEESWAVLAAMSEDLTVDEVVDAVSIAPGAAERAALQLTPDEQRALMKILREEVGADGT